MFGISTGGVGRITVDSGGLNLAGDLSVDGGDINSAAGTLRFMGGIIGLGCEVDGTNGDLGCSRRVTAAQGRFTRDAAANPALYIADGTYTSLNTAYIVSTAAVTDGTNLMLEEQSTLTAASSHNGLWLQRLMTAGSVTANAVNGAQLQIEDNTTDTDVTLQNQVYIDNDGRTITAVYITHSGTGAALNIQGQATSGSGDLVSLDQGSLGSTGRGLYVLQRGTGNAFQVDDVSGDTTPFTIDAAGVVSVGGNINTTLTSIDLLNTTATTINFGGAATTMSVGASSGTVSFPGDISVDGQDITSSGVDIRFGKPTKLAKFEPGSPPACSSTFEADQIYIQASASDAGGICVCIDQGSGSYAWVAGVPAPSTACP